MRCEQVRDAILEDRLPVEEQDQLAFDQHLAECNECGELKRTIQSLSNLAGSWQDEPVPPWNRHGVGGLPSGSGTRWQVWLPVAACFFLAILVTLKVDIRSDEQGLHIRFGEAIAQEDKREEWKAYVDQRLQENQEQSALAMQAALAEFGDNQNQYFKGLVNQLSNKHEKDRADDMQLLVNQWKSQRRKDLDVVTDRIQMLIDRQNRNTDNLYSLASYVNRKPDYRDR